MNLRASLPVVVLCGVLGFAAPADARQTAAADSSEAAAAGLPAPPVGAIQLATRGRVLADSAVHDRQLADRLRAVVELTIAVEDARLRLGELQALLPSMVGTGFVRTERLSRVEDQVLFERSRLDDIRGRLIDRTTQLEELEGRWAQRRRLWQTWTDTLRAEAGPDLAESEEEVAAALRRIEEVLVTAGGAATVLLDLQSRVEALQTELVRLGDTVARIRTRRADARFDRAEPILFSAAHRAQLREGGWRAWNPTAAFEARTYLAFLPNAAALLAIHALLALLVGGAMRALRALVPRSELPSWSGLPERPWATGVLVSVIVAMTRITIAPPLWDVLLWTLFWACVSILAHRAIRIRPLRLTVYLVSAFHPLFLLVEVSGVPEPVFRVGLAGLAVCAIALFLLLARHEASAGADVSGSLRGYLERNGSLLLGAGVWIGVLLALIVGFDPLARWALHAAATSAAVACAVALGFRLVRGTEATLSRLGEEGPLLRRAALLLVERSGPVARLTLLVLGGLALLDIWGVSGSPGATWARLMDVGFTVGSFRVSAGRILLAAFVVYLTVLVSRLIGSLATPAAGRTTSGRGTGGAPHAGRGVSESVIRLGQYALVAVGLTLALGAMGVKLQNFAIIAGALGIGVGFGLQNVVNNFASGLILLFERPVRVGDTVVVGGTWGTIRKIGLRSTVMLTLDESEMIVPNGDLVAEKVVNWTLSSPIARVFLPVGVAYGSSVAEVQSILLKAAFAHPTVRREPAPQALLMGFGESSLDFELRVWVDDIRLRLDMRSVVLADIDRRLHEAGIRIPFPQLDLHLPDQR